MHQAFAAHNHRAVDAQQFDALHPFGRDSYALRRRVGGKGYVIRRNIIDAVTTVDAERIRVAPWAVLVAGKAAAGADIGHIVRVGVERDAVTDNLINVHNCAGLGSCSRRAIAELPVVVVRAPLPLEDDLVRRSLDMLHPPHLRTTVAVAADNREQQGIAVLLAVSPRAVRGAMPDAVTLYGPNPYVGRDLGPMFFCPSKYPRYPCSGTKIPVL